MTSDHQDSKAVDPGEFRSGFVAILGQPNAGKSTLLNALVGEKIAAVSGLPQTTRDRIHGILTEPTHQIVFVDLPGLVQPDDKLNESLRHRILETLQDVDCVIHLVDTREPNPAGPEIHGLLQSITSPTILALNKAEDQDSSFDSRRWALALEPPLPVEKYARILPVSALHGLGLPELLAAVRALLPPGPPYFDPDQLTDRNLRFLSSEIIREKVYLHTHQEIPYSTAVQIEEFIERETGKWFISAVIHLERESQKGIVIGRGGEMLKRISREARQDIERLVGTGVFLELYVKVARNWRKSEARLREFGYELPRKKKRKRP